MRFNLKFDMQRALTERASCALRKLRTLRSDEQGTISILSVIVLLLLTMLLGMILNVGEQLDEKIELQNAADAASYSSGVVVARGMNTLAFTNYLLSETFALTAYFREGRDRSAESLVPEILDAWQALDQQLALSSFQLIRDIQPALIPRIQMEREMVRSFGDMTQAKARLLLPALEMILGVSEMPDSGAGGGSGATPQAVAASHLIPLFQRTVVLAIPAAATEMCSEVARRNARGIDGRIPQAVIWTSWVTPVQLIDHTNPRIRMLPGIDPSFEGPDFPYLASWEAAVYQQQARQRRDNIAKEFLFEWNHDRGFDLVPFQRENLDEGGRVYAKMSFFFKLWEGFTCGRLERLLNVEYPTTNLPHMLRMPNGENQQQFLENQYCFDTVVYRRQRRPRMPGMYRYPIRGDNLAFGRVTVFLPKPRLLTWPGCPRFHCPQWKDNAMVCLPGICRDGWPTEWSLFSQNWAAKMIPTSPQANVGLMQADPRQVAPGVTLPDMRSLQIQDMKAINFH